MGSRGDLQPYLAILLELQRRGHQVTMIGSVNFQAVAEAQAVPFVPLPGDFTKLLRSDQGLQLMQGKPVRLISDALLSELLETAHPAKEGTDLLLVSPLCLWGYHLAEATGCRLVVLSPVPIMATGDFPFLGFPASPTSETGVRLRRRMRRRLIRSSYRLVSLLNSILNFHWGVILQPPSVVDYVIVHELAHLVVPNHTPAFWQQVSRVLPDYEQRKIWLAEKGGASLALCARCQLRRRVPPCPPPAMAGGGDS